MADTADRTIPATPRRREQARRAGQEPTATLPAWAASAATAILLAPAWARSTVPAAAEAFREAASAAALPGEAAAPISLGVVMPSLGLIAASAAAGMAVHLATGGFSFQPARAAFTPQRINPLTGFQRIFSGGTLLGMLGHAAALSALVVIAVMAARPLAGMMLVPAEAPAVGDVAWRAIAWLAVAAAVLATVQWLVARRRFERRIMMTPQEFADEAKDLQADPRIKLLQQKMKQHQPKVKR
jgi:flagellar biosynthetic protein FlhB